MRLISQNQVEIPMKKGFERTSEPKNRKINERRKFETNLLRNWVRKGSLYPENFPFYPRRRRCERAQ